MISFLIYSKINDQDNWKMKKLHTNHKSYLLKPVTLVGASYFVCVCVCVCVCIYVCVCVCVCARACECFILLSKGGNKTDQPKKEY